MTRIKQPVITRTKQPDETFIDDDGVRRVPADSDVGTTHDPNSVTTGTDMEPDDRHPPKPRDE